MDLEVGPKVRYFAARVSAALVHFSQGNVDTIDCVLVFVGRAEVKRCFIRIGADRPESSPRGDREIMGGRLTLEACIDLHSTTVASSHLAEGPRASSRAHV